MHTESRVKYCWRSTWTFTEYRAEGGGSQRYAAQKTAI